MDRPLTPPPNTASSRLSDLVPRLPGPTGQRDAEIGQTATLLGQERLPGTSDRCRLEDQEPMQEHQSVVEQVQLFLLTAQSVVLCRVVHPLLGVSLCPREVRAKLFPETSRQTMANNVNAVRGPTDTREATEQERLSLHRLGAIISKTNKLTLVSIQCMHRAAARLRNSDSILMPLLGIPDLPRHEAAPVILTPARHSSEGTEPLTLPDCTVPSAQLNRRYSLPERQRSEEPLVQQLRTLTSWLTNPVQLDRECGYIGSRTMRNIRSDILLYLGYLHCHEAVAYPNLEAFLNLELYSKYISFQIAKGNSYNSLAHQLAHAKRVSQFLARGASSSLQASVSNIQTWLNRLKAQLGTLLVRPRADIGQLEAEGAWLDARTIVRVLDGFRLEVLRSLPEFGELSPYTARLLHDACLTSTLFGYLPPVRVACLRKLQMPSTTSCLDPDCRLPGCRGNRLELRPQGMWLVLPHHKNQKKWDNAAQTFRIPDELARLIDGYIQRGHQVASPGCRYVFSNKQGQPFTDAANLTYYWSKVSKKIGLPATIPPTRLRHIFVDERRSLNRAEGPADADAAMVMGNSTRAWDRYYDVRFQQRGAAAAVTAMIPWRQDMLAAASPQPALATSLPDSGLDAIELD